MQVFKTKTTGACYDEGMHAAQHGTCPSLQGSAMSGNFYKLFPNF
jgi:hypothetical protein